MNRRTILIILTVLAICGNAATAMRAEDGESPTIRAESQETLLAQGEAIYRRQCVVCHGPRGEGVTDKHPDPLIGDSSVRELAEVVNETMPEDDPGSCVGSDASAVAAYMHHSFYSEAAQIRNRPPRIGLARLTATQLRQSYADLYAHFYGVPSYTDQRGIKGIYFDGARWKNENKKLERVDPTIEFNFGHETPSEGIKPEAFYIYWEGSLKPDATGRYEIIVRSTCSFVFNFGNLEREFINNHVQSGDKTEFRRVVTLNAGRLYPFKIDFIQRERKTEKPPAQISLSWVKPHGVEEVIPTQYLIPHATEATYALQTTLPADDRSYGYERGIAVSRQWDDSTTSAAIEFAQVAVDELWPRYRRKHRKDSNENRSQLRDFLNDIVSVAFRGTLDETTRAAYIDRQVDATEDDGEAIKRSLLISLKSARFLYPNAVDRESTSRRIANRLALTLFDSLPSDEWLLDKIDKDQIKSEQQVRDAAVRMVSDFRTRGKTRELMYEWLNLSQVVEVSKSKAAFPEFDAVLVSDLRASLDAFLDEVLWSEASDYRLLLQADWSMTTDRIAKYFGDPWKPLEETGTRLRRTASDPAIRSGVLTHPYILSVLAYHDSTSPIHRGVFLIRYLLGRTLRPPAEAFTPLSPDLHPDLTTRQRVALQTSPESCQVCHSKINGLGFTLENYDAVGRFQSKERDQPIDAGGGYTARSGENVSFTGVHALASYLASSEDAHQAFVSRVFQHFVKQPMAAYGPETQAELLAKFRSSGFNIRNLIVEVAVIAASDESALREGT